jgi:integrase
MPAVQRAAIQPPPRFHDLRHHAAAAAIAQGAHLKAISAPLGHASVAMTLDVYGHLFPSLDEDLATRLDSAYLSATRSRHEEASEEASKVTAIRGNGA